MTIDPSARPVRSRVEEAGIEIALKTIVEQAATTEVIWAYSVAVHPAGADAAVYAVTCNH
jgi:hypothetical protein